MKPLILYGTLGCHLCEQALEIMTPLLAGNVEITEVDISESDDLMERYALRIPVIARVDNGREIGWPFDGQQLLQFLE